MCEIDSQRELAVWLGKLKQGLCINLEGWDGEGDGREFQKELDICILILKEMGIPDRPPNLPLEESVCRSGSNS